MSDARNEILKEILNLTDGNPHGRIKVLPRVGKTKIAISVIKQNDPRSVLWVTVSSDLATVEIPKEFITWKAKKYLPRLTCTTYSSLHNCEGHYDLIILDEEQSVTLNNTVNFFNGKLTYGAIFSMTGTPTKDKDKKSIYKSLGLFPIFDMEMETAVTKDLLSDYKINVVMTNLSSKKDIQVKLKDKSFFTSEIANYNYLSSAIMKSSGSKQMFLSLNRMKLLQSSQEKFEAAKILMDNLEGRKMIFCPTVEMAENICENFYHGKSADPSVMRKFIDGKITSISLVNKGGTGMTYHNINHLILVQANSDNNGTTSQKIYRALLKQKNHKATIWVLCCDKTVDINWVNSSLSAFDINKIFLVQKNNLLNEIKNGNQPKNN